MADSWSSGRSLALRVTLHEVHDSNVFMACMTGVMYFYSKGSLLMLRCQHEMTGAACLGVQMLRYYPFLHGWGRHDKRGRTMTDEIFFLWKYTTITHSHMPAPFFMHALRHELIFENLLKKLPDDRLSIPAEGMTVPAIHSQAPLHLTSR